jgi:hypothetical protein
MLYWRQHSFSTGHIPPLCQGCSGRNAQGNHLNKDLAAFIEQQRIGYVRSPGTPAASPVSPAVKCAAGR